MNCIRSDLAVSAFPASSRRSGGSRECLWSGIRGYRRSYMSIRGCRRSHGIIRG
jgi:hypothetical protein